MAPGRYDLCSLNAAKAWLGTTSGAGDADLARLITAASRFVLSYLSRGNILSAPYTDRIDGLGYGQRRIMLKRWPVTSITAFSIGTNVVPISAAPGPGAPSPNGALLSPTDGIPPGNYQWIDLYGYGLPACPQIASVSYVAGYMIAAEAATIPATPFQLTSAAFLAPYGAWAADAGITFADGTPLALIPNGTPSTGQYTVTVDADSYVATYQFAAADTGKPVLISYSYVPADLAQAAIELVAIRSIDRTHIGQSSKTLGGQETIAYTTKDLPDPMRLYLQNYKAVVPL